MWRAINEHCSEAANFPGTIAGGEVFVYKCAGGTPKG